MNNENKGSAATPCSPTHIGGQAVLEGVMMRGKNTWAVAARDPEGIIHVEQYPLKSAAAHNKWMRWPVVRGVVALVESLMLGTKALTISARLAGFDDEPNDEPNDEPVDEPVDENTEECVQTSGSDITGSGKPVGTLSERPRDGFAVTQLSEGQTEPNAEPAERQSALTNGMIVGSIVLGVALAVGMFILLPAFITDGIMSLAGSANPGARNHFGWNALDGLVRILIFFGYVYAISFMPDIKRVFRYHGAEHKVIHAVEHGDPLTVEAARAYPTLHARCGTAFLIMVMALAILVFSLVPVSAMASAWGITNRFAVLGIRIASRLLLMPLVAGLAYEVTVKWAAPRADRWYVKPLLWPGLQMQRLTTGEPDDEMLEVAIASTCRVLESEADMPAESGESDNSANSNRVESVQSGDEPALSAEFDLLDDAL